MTYMMQMKTVREVCDLTGVTRKQLFYYDRIGLLKPTKRTGPQRAKLYGPKAVERLNLILMYQKAGLHLIEISEILDCGSLRAQQILCQAIERLENESAQIQKKICFARDILSSMDHH